MTGFFTCVPSPGARCEQALRANTHLDPQAARDVGFRCVWIDRHTARRPLSDYTPDAVFERLDHVPVFFTQLGW